MLTPPPVQRLYAIYGVNLPTESFCFYKRCVIVSLFCFFVLLFFSFRTFPLCIFAHFPHCCSCHFFGFLFFRHTVFLKFSCVFLTLMKRFVFCLGLYRSKSQPWKVKIDTHVNNSTINLQGYEIQKVCYFQYFCSCHHLCVLFCLLLPAFSCSLFPFTRNTGYWIRNPFDCTAKYQDIYWHRGMLLRGWHCALPICTS